jgi:porin
MKRIISIVVCSAFFSTMAYASYNPSYLASQRELKKLKEIEQVPRCSERQQYMFGDWNCLREELENEGVLFSSTFTCDVLGDVAGGMKQGGRYDHSMGWDVNFDLEKFVGMVGTQFHISGLWRAGQNLSKAVVGNDIVCSTIFGNEQFRFYFLYLEQDLFDKRLNVRLGRIAAGDDFATSPLYGIYVSNGIDGVPITIPINMFFSVYATATWGARAKFNINEDFYTFSGIYDGDKGVSYNDLYGFDFSLRLKQGLAFAQELAYAPAKGIGPGQLPGHYKAGIYYNGATCRDLYSDINGNSYSVTQLDRKKHIGNYNVYIHADQMIWREKGTKDQGIIPWTCAVLGDQNINKFPFFLMGGLVYKGMVPTRDNDVTAVGLMYAKYSDKLKESQQSAGSSPQQYEIALEFTHRVQITKWMYFQPDLQYIIQPGGTGNIDDALVIGFQAGLTF